MCLAGSDTDTIFSSLVLFTAMDPPPTSRVRVFPKGDTNSVTSAESSSVPLTFRAPLGDAPAFPFMLGSTVEFPLSSIMYSRPFT